jgi:hypothetical protein
LLGRQCLLGMPIGITRPTIGVFLGCIAVSPLPTALVNAGSAVGFASSSRRATFTGAISGQLIVVRQDSSPTAAEAERAAIARAGPDRPRFAAVETNHASGLEFHGRHQIADAATGPAGDRRQLHLSAITRREGSLEGCHVCQIPASLPACWCELPNQRQCFLALFGRRLYRRFERRLSSPA